MWAFARGSHQPLQHGPPSPRDAPRSVSAPQLTTTERPRSLDRPSFLPGPRHRQPGPSFRRLYSEDQLSALSSLPADEAMSALVSWLPEDVTVPTLHAPTVAVLLYSVLRWATYQQFDHEQTSALLTVYLNTFFYCVESQWRTQSQLYAFFKESILCCSVHRPPRSERVLSPAQCRDSLLHFCRRFLTCLPLVRMVCLPNYRLHLIWTAPSDSLNNVPK